MLISFQAHFISVKCKVISTSEHQKNKSVNVAFEKV